MRRMMMPLIVLLAVGMTAAVALANSVNLKSRSVSTTTNSSAGTFNVTGTLTGLGSTLGTISVTAQGTSEFTCANPSQHIPPGQQPGPTTFTGAVPINPNSITRNGNYDFSVTTAAPASPCKTSSGWTSSLTSFSVSSYTLTVTQGGSTTTLGPFSP